MGEINIKTTDNNVNDIHQEFKLFSSGGSTLYCGLFSCLFTH